MCVHTCTHVCAMGEVEKEEKIQIPYGVDMVFRWANFATQKRSGEAIMLQRDMTEKTSTTLSSQVSSFLRSSSYLRFSLCFVLCVAVLMQIFFSFVFVTLLSVRAGTGAHFVLHTLYLIPFSCVCLCVSYATCIAVLHVYVCFAYDLCLSQEKNQNVHIHNGPCLGRNYLLTLVDVHNLMSPALQLKTLFS